ncbi:PTS glucose transporter subunit IIA [Alkalimonas amylolytica]|uniref:Phosphotransferase system IIA component n=1 Tax=Alkalimonas amylolytica TaxID=152573 RepID=A0A1H4AZE2_ALKAM|nr:PTS glucose transporter subunit IIA [Alkalimonas amylolytica]SEA41184.1 Phosphotransferase system IIA component [Alkalimonas amylolytica]
MHPDTDQASNRYRFAIQSPADGVLQPLSQHPRAAIQRLAGLGFCLQATSHYLLSPCAGTTSVHFLPHPCIRVRHNSGLQVRVDLPLAWLERLGVGLRWQLNEYAVAAGQLLLEIDPGYLSSKPVISVAVFPHPAVRAEPQHFGQTVLAKEPCFFIQMTGNNP